MEGMEYRGYQLFALPYETHAGGWAVAVKIRRAAGFQVKDKDFYPDDNIVYLGEDAAMQAALQLGRWIIDEERVGF